MRGLLVVTLALAACSTRAERAMRPSAPMMKTSNHRCADGVPLYPADSLEASSEGEGAPAAQVALPPPRAHEQAPSCRQLLRLTADAREAVAAGDCATLTRIDEEICVIDPSYLANEYVTRVDASACRAAPEAIRTCRERQTATLP